MNQMKTNYSFSRTFQYVARFCVNESKFMKHFLSTKLFAFIVLIVSLQSCKLREKTVYFQDFNETIPYTDESRFNPKIKVDDLLYIKISDIDPESARVYNGINDPTVPLGYQTGNMALDGYLVDKNGNVNMPVIGQVSVLNKSRDEAAHLIEEKLKDFLKTPIVHITILNFKVTVLGEVASPNTYRIPNERISILEAIGLAGDLKMTAKRKNVLVIRETPEGRQSIRVDLTSKKLLESPAYYLQQNDVVYVEPNATALSSSSFFKGNGTIILSSITVVVSILTFLIR